MNLSQWLEENKTIFTGRDLRFLIKNIFPGNDHYLDSSSLPEEKVSLLNNIKAVYSSGVPIAYILGKEEFYGMEFKINSSVLIPRKETELIVEKTLEVIEKNNIESVLDLCCGSGNIGVCLKKYSKKNIKVFCSDISMCALNTAEENSLVHNTETFLVNSDLFEGFMPGSFDLIVSNPPYVATEEITGSLMFEPRPALEAGVDGFRIIAKILNNAHIYLRENGFLVLEIGSTHKKYVEQHLLLNNLYEAKEWIRDYSDFWRGIVLKRK